MSSFHLRLLLQAFSCCFRCLSCQYLYWKSCSCVFRVISGIVVMLHEIVVFKRVLEKGGSGFMLSIIPDQNSFSCSTNDLVPCNYQERTKTVTGSRTKIRLLLPRSLRLKAEHRGIRITTRTTKRYSFWKCIATLYAAAQALSTDRWPSRHWHLRRLIFRIFGTCRQKSHREVPWTCAEPVLR